MDGKTLLSACRMVLLSTLVLAVLVRATPLRADPANWAPGLGRQLNNEKSCKVLLIINVREYKLLGHDIVEARVNCVDGRSFDVIRRGVRLPFEINACKPVAC